MRFFDLAKRTEFKNATIAAFGSTRKVGITPDKDQNLAALLESGTSVVTIFGKTWDLHVKKIIKTTLEENLAMIYESVEYLKENDREVIYDAEHFFDGYKNNRDYALQTLMTALDGGADFLVLCDTNGGTLPFEIESIMEDVSNTLSEKYNSKPDALPIKYGIHTHNDSGLAVANSISAIQSGAVMVQGTINGYGERCGNADLISIIPILCLKMNSPSVSRENIAKLKKLSRFVSQTANLVPLNSRPFVGESAFAHKGGIHVDAVMKDSRAYEHMDPILVGNKRRVLVSDLSGKSNIEYKIKELGVELGENGLDSRKIVSQIKQMEHEGYQFEAADGSLKILMEKLAEQFQPMFDLESFRVIIEKNKDESCKAQATIEVSVGGKTEITAAKGDGPVSALDNALRKALEKFYLTDLDTMRLVDYKVRVIDGREGTAARVRVMVESRDKDDIWKTIGVSHDIIEASWHALEDSFQYKLSKEKP
jgi:2-isopropylmalate synthase